MKPFNFISDMINWHFFVVRSLVVSLLLNLIMLFLLLNGLTKPCEDKNDIEKQPSYHQTQK